MAEPLTITVLEGDETGQELLEQALRVLDPDVLGLAARPRALRPLAGEPPRDRQRRRRRGREGDVPAGLGIKAATITPEGKDDVGSPNRLLREGIDGKVIIRTGRRIPGVTPVARRRLPDQRRAHGGRRRLRRRAVAREDEGARRDRLRTERISRDGVPRDRRVRVPHRAAMGAKVYGGPKWTVSPVYEGMLKEELDAAAERHPEVAYQPVLIDATYAGLISGVADMPLVIPALNRDGDCLSDLVMPMFGSIAGAETVLLAFDDDHEIDVAMAEAPHGTAPALQGKDIANPMAMILAVRRGPALRGAARARRRRARLARDLRVVLEATAAGVRTPDLGGHAATTEFTDDVIAGGCGRSSRCGRRSGSRADRRRRPAALPPACSRAPVPR